MPSGQPQGAMYLILWLLLKDTRQASAGCPSGQPQGAMYLILWLFLKYTSKDRPKVRALQCVRYGGLKRTPQAGPRGPCT